MNTSDLFLIFVIANMILFAINGLLLGRNGLLIKESDRLLRANKENLEKSKELSNELIRQIERYNEAIRRVSLQ